MSSGAVQTEEHSGHQAGVSGYKQERRVAELQTQAARSPDCEPGKEPFHLANPQEKSDTRKRSGTTPESGEAGQN